MELRPVTAAELPELVRVIAAAAGLHATDDSQKAAFESYDPDHTIALLDDGRVVGGTSWDVLHVTVPGPAAVPTARIAATGVLPSHRRRGYFREMMVRQLLDIRRRGHCVAILTAAEGGIYRRFGYGPAGYAMDVEIDRRRARLGHHHLELPGRLELIDPFLAVDTLAEVFDRHRLRQPGQVSRSPAYWNVWAGDAERQRAGYPPRFVALAIDGAGTATGYVSYRFPKGFERPTPDRDVWVEELVVSTDDAYRLLWSYCLNLDLVGRIKAPNVPVDQPLSWMLDDPRAVEVTGLRDFLWIRLVDVPAALGARSYDAVGDLVIEVADPVLPDNAGRYLLQVGPDDVRCGRTDEPADLCLDVAHLGETFLGGAQFSSLARVGLVTELRPGSVRRADAMFQSVPAPWTVTDW